VPFEHSQANRDTRPHLIGGNGDLVWEAGKFSNPPERDRDITGPVIHAGQVNRVGPVVASLGLAHPCDPSREVAVWGTAKTRTSATRRTRRPTKVRWIVRVDPLFGSGVSRPS